jgi:hypothetical protein
MIKVADILMKYNVLYQSQVADVLMEEADVSVLPITHGKKSVFLVAVCLYDVCQCVMPIAEGKKVQEFVSRVTLYTRSIMYE